MTMIKIVTKDQEIKKLERELFWAKVRYYSLVIGTYMVLFGAACSTINVILLLINN